MPVSAFTYFDAFIEAVAEKKHNLGSDVLKIYLTNNTPDVALDLIKTDLAEIAAAGGYPAGGFTVTITGSSQSGGNYNLSQTADISLTASGASFGPFRYAILYNDTATNDDLIGYWDYGSSITVGDGETLQIDLAANFLTGSVP